VIALNLRWFYLVLWLGKDVMNALQGLVIWGLAGAVCDTRQAKRLFPLFTAGSIFGSVVGASGTPLLVSILHAENLLLVWAGALGVAFALAWALIGRAKGGAGDGSRATRRAVRHKPPSFVGEMLQGYRVVRVWNNEVMTNIDGVCASISAAAFEATADTPSRNR
jgi:hypothetical protein